MLKVEFEDADRTVISKSVTQNGHFVRVLREGRTLYVYVDGEMILMVLTSDLGLSNR